MPPRSAGRCRTTGVDDFLTAMQFAPGDQRLFREAAKRIGLD